MKTYFSHLLIILSLISLTASGIAAQERIRARPDEMPESTGVKAKPDAMPASTRIKAKPSSLNLGNKKVLPRQAVERFFTVKQLSKTFFTPSFLAKGDLNQIQSGRDEAVTMLTQKFGAFKTVELKEAETYRIIFGNADKDTVLGQFRFDRNGRIDDMDMRVNAR
jgi:hypothetical protein